MWWWWWCVWGGLLLVVLPWLLCLPWHAIFLNECPVNGRPDERCWCDRYLVELAKTRDQCHKSQCPIGLLWIHEVSRRCNTYKLVDDIQDKLRHMNTDLGHDAIDQLTFR